MTFNWTIEDGNKWSMQCNGTAIRSIEIRKEIGLITLCEIELLGIPSHRCKCQHGTPIPGYYCHADGEQVPVCIVCSFPSG